MSRQQYINNGNNRIASLALAITVYISGFLVIFRHCRDRGAKKAFTLPEVLVAISVLILVISAAINLTVSNIRSNQSNADSIIAYGLAQEALEALRNIRDSNWLLGADFQGKVGETCIWGNCLPDSFSQTQYFVIDRNSIAQSSGAEIELSQISQYAPWKLLAVSARNSNMDLGKTRLYLENQDFTRYKHVFSGEPVGDAYTNLLESKFYRYLEVTPGNYKNGLKTMKYQISAVVKWRDGLRDREVRLVTELTDWKGGAL